MASPSLGGTLALCLDTLAAEGIDPPVLASLGQVMKAGEPFREQDRRRWSVDGQVRIECSPYGSLDVFLPLAQPATAARRLAGFDRRGRLLSLFFYAENGRLQAFKVRIPDGRFLGVLRGAASHLGWGASDVIGLLAGEGGFDLDRTLSLCRAVRYEDVDSLPPLDAPACLPTGGGTTLLNALARLAHDQAKPALRYCGPYPSDRLFFTLRESFRCAGEVGVNRERFTHAVEDAALSMAMREAAVDWRPAPHERFYPAAHTCVQLRDGVEKVYDHGHTYYRADLMAEAHRLRVLRTEAGRTRYVASLTILSHALEDHLILDENGEILERPPVPPPPVLRGDPSLSADWKAALMRLIAADSTALLHTTLWPALDELALRWGRVDKELWALDGNTLVLHAGMVTVYRAALKQADSAGERLLLASRFLSELARLIGPLIRTRAQTRLAGLSPTDQNVALLFAAPETPGLSDGELRAFLTRLAQGEALPENATDSRPARRIG